MKMRPSFVAPLVAAFLFAPRAHAALTSSERGQIASYVAEARPATAARVRALVARPDLTADESADALQAALAPVAFNDARAAYVHEMLYGPSSLPSRGVVAVALTRALLARADGVIARHDADLDEDPPSVAELVRIYAAIDADVANAGAPHGAAHDPNGGIESAAYDDVARALGEHVAKHPRWLRGDAKIPAAAMEARAQLAIALYDAMNDTPTRKVDAADKLGFVGPRRALLTEQGVLLLDDGHADAASIETVRGLAARLDAGRVGVEAIVLGDRPGRLHGRGDVVTGAVATAPARVFGEDVAGPAVDFGVAMLSLALADRLVTRAFEVRSELKARADADAGEPAKSKVGTEASLLALDAAATLDRAMVHFLAGDPRELAFVSDAMGAMAAFAPATPGGLALSLGNGQATNVRLAPAGYATSFVFASHGWLLARDGEGKMLAPKRDGAPLAFAMLRSARVPVAAGTVWDAGGLVFAKMAGAPKAGVQPGGRVRLVGTSAHGIDAIATAAPGDDVTIDGHVDPRGNTAIAARAVATPSGFKGVALVIDADRTPARISLRAWDDAGAQTELAPTTDAPGAAPFTVRLVVKGSKVDAKVGDKTLTGAIPPALAHGDVALVVSKGGALDVDGFALKKP